MYGVMYGAGNIGRGFIAPLFAASGYKVIFIDIAEDVISALNRDGRYPVRVLSTEGGHEDQWVVGVSAVAGNDAEEAAAAIAGAGIMATAVGVRILPLIAPLIAWGIKKRFAETTAPLNIIICENLIGADTLLANLIKENLNDHEKELFCERIGLVEASIGRMVPLQTPEMRGDNPLRVCVEAYGFLPVDKAAFKGPVPRIAGMIPCENFDFYIKRKLFVHNMGHAVCAYLGLLKGEKYICRAITQGDVFSIVQNAMRESAEALSVKFGFPLVEIERHILDLLRRFANEALGDTCARVAADTARKLAREDRLLGAWQCCRGEGGRPAFISIGIAAALYRYLEEQHRGQTGDNAKEALEGFLAPSAEGSAVEGDSTDAAFILLMYDLIVKGADFSHLITLAVNREAQEIV